jgi:Kef-type K+ transport system membrane component KefB
LGVADSTLLLMEPFTAAPHHDVLIVLAQLSMLLFSARALGEWAQRLGQPSVVGEILAGIILGPSLLSGLFPFLGQWLIPQNQVQGYLLELSSLLGAMFLLLITGLETDLALIRHHARTAMGVSLGGILVTLSSGFFLGLLLPDALLVNTDERLVFALFMATAMSISAIPVIAKVLMDLKLMRRDVGQTIIAAGMSDDTIGWILLSIVAGLASGEEVTTVSVLSAVGKVFAFMALSFTLGRWLIKKALDFVQDEVISEERLLTLVVVCTFTWGAVSQALHLEAVLGAFVVGILFGQMPRFSDVEHRKLGSVTLGIFAPIFFAVAGLKVNILHLLEPQLFTIALLVIVVATAGKIIGTYTGARVIGRRDHWTALSFGAGLNARGAMEIIIATIGMSLGVLSQEMFSIIVLMAMATSLMAPTALRWVLQRIPPDEQEQQRLQQEALAEGSLVSRLHRVLLPVRRRDDRGRDVQTIEAHVLEKLSSKTPLSITLFNVSEPSEKAQGTAFLDQLRNLFSQKEITIKVLEGGNPAELILDEARKYYDLIVLGASEKDSTSKVVFNPMVDYLLRVSPCPTMVVKGQLSADRWPPRRILVPTNGTTTARHAAEIAFVLASGEAVEVIVLNVVVQDTSSYHLDAGGSVFESQVGIAYQIVNTLSELGKAQGVRTEGAVRVGASPETTILDFASKQAIDLIVLGTGLRPGSDRLFLGPRVERILNNTPYPVVVVNAS